MSPKIHDSHPEHGLVFNKDKCAVTQTFTALFGCVYDANWAHPDPEKDSAVHKMPAHETATQFGNLPVTLHTLMLLLPCTPIWATEERNSVHMEQILSRSFWQSQINGLQGYHSAVLWCPQACHCPSQCIPKRPRCCPTSRGPPSCFASKALTPVEQHYANIEHELLTCVLRAEWFHTYVFGCTFTIESDHKPLEQINIKNLADTPVHLQRMLL